MFDGNGVHPTVGVSSCATQTGLKWLLGIWDLTLQGYESGRTMEPELRLW